MNTGWAASTLASEVRTAAAHATTGCGGAIVATDMLASRAEQIECIRPTTGVRHNLRLPPDLWKGLQTG
jgi:hypothetical protein